MPLTKHTPTLPMEVTITSDTATFHTLIPDIQSGCPDLHTKHLLALTRAAKKYPKVKGLIRKIKENKRRSDWLAQ